MKDRVRRWMVGLTMCVALSALYDGSVANGARKQQELPGTAGVTEIVDGQAASNGAMQTVVSTTSINGLIVDAGSLNHILTVTSSRLGTVFDVNVRVRIVHVQPQDLDLFLIAPDGTTTQLATDLGTGAGYGGGSAGCAGDLVEFDDEAPRHIGAVPSPFVGNLRPEGALSSMRGKAAVGNWTLRIVDDLANAVSGVLQCWELRFTHNAAPGDTFFPNDGRADIAVWRPAATGFVFARTLDGLDSGLATAAGTAGDIPVSADYARAGFENGLSFFRPSTGEWRIAPDPPIVFGINGDIPVPGNYDGDGFADIAVFRPSEGTWYMRNIGAVAWGTPGDIPVPADYNGDGRTDVAVWRPSEGVWFVRNVVTVPWGIAGDIPAPADYDGDGKAEIAVFRPSNGTWYILSSDASRSTVVPWGTTGDIPIPADYDADGKADIAVFRPSDGGWYIRNIGVIPFGIAGDIPHTKRPSYPGYPF